jgi:hypothetical protein
MQKTIQDAIHNVRQIIGLLLGAISPLALLGFLIGFFGLIGSTISHVSYLRNLERWGYVTSAVVEYRHPNGDEVSVSFIDREGDERSAVLKRTYSSPERWEMLTPGTEVEIRALPTGIPNFGEVIVADTLSRMRQDRPYLEPSFLGVLGVCWMLLVIKPQIVYAGLVDNDRLLKDGLEIA